MGKEVELNDKRNYAKLIDADLFVTEYVLHGDAKRAAIAAGATNPRTGYALVTQHADKIRQATLDKINSHAPQAIQVLQGIMMDAEAGDQARIAAASKIASYAGIDVARTEDVTKRDTRSDDEIRQAMIMQVQAMPADLKLQLRQALGDNPDNVAILKQTEATGTTQSDSKAIGNGKV